jgi:hypothetical protein
LLRMTHSKCLPTNAARICRLKKDDFGVNDVTRRIVVPGSQTDEKNARSA